METTYMDWDARYARNPRPFGEEPTGFVHDVFNAPATYGVHGDPEHMHVLCPGDGYGRNGLWLAGLGYQVTGLELVQSAVEDAHARAREGNCACYVPLQADLSRPPFPLPQGSGFDLIVSAWVHLPTEQDRRRCNTECLRLRLGPVAWWQFLRRAGRALFVEGLVGVTAGRS